MPYEDLLNITVDIIRKTSIMYSGAISASFLPTYQPVRASYLLLTMASLTGSGNITVSGTVSGSADTEVFSFSADGISQGSKQFTAITSIAVAAGITAGTLTVETVTDRGSPQYQEYTSSASIKARIEEEISTVNVVTPGGEQSTKLRMFCLAGADLLENDIVLSGTTRYIITSVVLAQDFDATHHPEALLQLEGRGS